MSDEPEQPRVSNSDRPGNGYLAEMTHYVLRKLDGLDDKIGSLEDKVVAGFTATSAVLDAGQRKIDDHLTAHATAKARLMRYAKYTAYGLAFVATAVAGYFGVNLGF